MPIGDSYATILKNPLSKFTCRLFGTPDLHTHIRLRDMIRFFKDYFNQHSVNNIKILELGCSSGINAFEIYKIARKKNIDLDYTGVDLSSGVIRQANNLLGHSFLKKGKMSFYQEEAINFLENNQGLKFDAILLIDIIEHIKEPQKLLFLCRKYLKKDGLFIISVPTPLYPKFFGRKFHAQIGHLIDGYSLPLIDEYLRSLNCRRIIYKYNTGIFSNLGCWLYYNKLNYDNKYFNFLKSLILYPFKFFDFVNNSRVSCSLFVVYKNEK